MSSNPLKFILKHIKSESYTKNAEKPQVKHNNRCGLCALCGEFA